jgi:hypothetical protein
MIDRDTLREGGFSWQRALSLALASQLAYQRSEGIERVANEMWGFDDCIALDEKECRAFVCWDQNCVVVSYRGTDSLGDWLRSMKVAPATRPMERSMRAS